MTSRGGSKSFFGTFKSYDIYPKLQEGWKEKTFTGATISVISALLVTLLLVNEMSMYLTDHVKEKVVLDRNGILSDERLSINFDITFPRVPCEVLHLDAMDIGGNYQEDITHNINKQSLDHQGVPKRLEAGGQTTPGTKRKEDDAADAAALHQEFKKNSQNPDYCGDCYGASEGCCNTCEALIQAHVKKGWSTKGLNLVAEQCIHPLGQMKELEEAMARGGGCQIFGYIQVKKVAGNFHIAPGRAYQSRNHHLHDMKPFAEDQFDFSHTVHKLSFGADIPGIVHPLHNVQFRADKSGSKSIYYTEVVPTTYKQTNGLVVEANQYSVAEHHQDYFARDHNRVWLPGVFVHYTISPIRVVVTHGGETVARFLVQLCAIIGGTFTLAGLFDRLLHGVMSIGGHDARAKSRKPFAE